ncbi:KptA family-domain-containing protein [Boletus edulis BED1]|uniref:2'-phosphotransferase n=1 Tax=Boletus edulis BED1 TaxID=1328754 RepID=A0AAD4C5A5_BOLED|nr:KptA family-domain-containing protein [Boletus edulis BED1]
MFRVNTALDSVSLRRIIVGQHFYYPKMSQQHQEQGQSAKKGPSPKPRGHPRDSPDVRISKSLSYLLRHGAEKAGLNIRQDGYAKVSDVLANPMFRDVTFIHLQDIVKRDQKSRYHLLFEPQTLESACTDVWWIRANQGHSIKNIELDLQLIESASEIPMAVHGTTRQAWNLIATQGLSKMKRNHIHLAQDVPGSGVISGMRNSSQILIFVDVQKALDAGIRFCLSANGVVLTEGNGDGFLSPEFFLRVENGNRTPLQGWEGSGPIVLAPLVQANIKVDDVVTDGAQPENLLS